MRLTNSNYIHCWYSYFNVQKNVFPNQIWPKGQLQPVHLRSIPLHTWCWIVICIHYNPAKYVLILKRRYSNVNLMSKSIFNTHENSSRHAKIIIKFHARRSSSSEGNGKTFVMFGVLFSLYANILFYPAGKRILRCTLNHCAVYIIHKCKKSNRNSVILVSYNKVKVFHFQVHRAGCM